MRGAAGAQIEINDTVEVGCFGWLVGDLIWCGLDHAVCHFKRHLTQFSVALTFCRSLVERRPLDIRETGCG